MSEAQDKTIARRFNEKVWGKGDQNVLEESLDPDFVDHDALPGQVPGREGHKQILAAFLCAFPGLNVTTKDIVAEADKVVSRWTARHSPRGTVGHSSYWQLDYDQGDKRAAPRRGADRGTLGTV